MSPTSYQAAPSRACINHFILLSSDLMTTFGHFRFISPTRIAFLLHPVPIYTLYLSRLYKNDFKEALLESEAYHRDLKLFFASRFIKNITNKLTFCELRLNNKQNKVVNCSAQALNCYLLSMYSCFFNRKLNSLRQKHIPLRIIAPLFISDIHPCFNF